jgi:hypothetical protein
MCEMPVPSVTAASRLQFSNAPASILVTLLGISMLVNDRQSLKAFAPILVTPAGMFMLVKAVSLNASFPIVLIEEGKCTTEMKEFL